MAGSTSLPAPPWSKSSLDEILHGCSWRYKLKKVDRLPDPGTPATAGGTAYHTAIEAHEQARINARRTGGAHGSADGIPLESMERLALDTLEDEWQYLTAEIIERHQTLEATQLEVVSALRNWWHHGLRSRLLDLVPLQVEPYFRQDWAGSGIHGFIDLVAWDPDLEAWVVVDHKTAGSLGRWPHGGAGHEIEAAVYVVGSLLAPHLPSWNAPVRMEWHVARKKESDHAKFIPARIVGIDLDDWHYESLAMDLEQADRVVREGDYHKNPAWNLCSAKWCPFHIENEGPCDPEAPEQYDR